MSNITQINKNVLVYTKGKEPTKGHYYFLKLTGVNKQDKKSYFELLVYFSNA